MSQFDFGTIDPNSKSGPQLALDLNQFRDALNSGHRGEQRPPYAKSGMSWVREVSSERWDLMIYDGTADQILRSINPSTGKPLQISQESVQGLVELRQAVAANGAVMKGATASVPGVKGLVPAPAVGDQAKFLTGAGTYLAPSVAWGGITGLISDQADLKATLDTKVATESLGLSKRWSSGPISWSVAGILNLTHNLGIEPAIVVVKGRYKAALNGMAIGESEFSVGILYQSAFLGVIARKPTTTTLQIQVARDGLRLSNAAGELVAVTPAQVDLVVEIWA